MQPYNSDENTNSQDTFIRLNIPLNEDYAQDDTQGSFNDSRLSMDSDLGLATSDSMQSLYRPSLDLDSTRSNNSVERPSFELLIPTQKSDNRAHSSKNEDTSEFSFAAEFNYRSTDLSLALERAQHAPKDIELVETSQLKKTVADLESGTRDEEVDEEEEVSQQSQVLENPELQRDLKVDYHLIPIEELEQRTESDLVNGLTTEKARSKLARDGPNVIKNTNYLSYVFKFIAYFFGGFSLILWPAGILCILAYKPFGKPPDPASLGLGIVIFIVILLNGIFNAYQDYQSLKVMKSISKMLPQTTVVIRNGSATEVLLKDIVVGDVLQLNNGVKVPADCRIIDSQQLRVDKSILTGESEPVACSVKHTDLNYMESKNLLFMGASIVEGSGTAIVVATGNNSVMGTIYKLSGSATSSSTPIKREINIFLLIVVFLAALVCVSIILAWSLWLRKKYPSFLSLSAVIVVIIGAVVGLLPDGLPVSVTLTFSLIARKMFEHHVMVKNLPTVETLGSISVIASDKTGTLTQNAMSLMHIFLSAKYRFQVGEEIRQLQDNNPAFMELLKTCCLCNRAVFDESTANYPIQQRKVVGDASDTALLLFAEDMIRTTDFRARYKKLAEIPFNSKNKWMLSIYEEPNNNKASGREVCLMMKGAPEMILDRCTTILMEDGQEYELTQSMRERIALEQELLSQCGERVLGLSCTYLDQKLYPASYNFDPEARNFPMENLCFVGLVALIDPPRTDVPDAVKQCQTAGIRVMMVTGDHPTTAVAIARMVNIITNPDVDTITCDADIERVVSQCNTKKEKKKLLSTRSAVVRGSDIPDFGKKAWPLLLEYKELVFARTTPEHKLKIVQECQKKKHVVAAIGDGVNDSPALKQSNVGVAMGSGSDVAREAADIVLTDSSFSSIVAGIKYGRIAFDNLKKVLIFMLAAGSFSELMPVLANVFLGLPLPLSSFLMVVICAATDVLPSLTLIYEQGELSIMERKPRSVTGETLVNAQLLAHAYFFLGVLEAASAFGMYFYYMNVYGGFKIRDLFFAFDKYSEGFYGKTQKQLDDLLYTSQCVYFVTLVIVQLSGNLIATRTRRLSFFQQSPFSGESKNTTLFIGAFLSVIVAMGTVYLPVFNNIFNTRHIPTQFWFIPIGCGLVIFALDELRKLIVRQIPWERARRVAW